MKITSGAGILMLWIDVEPDLVRETDAWYVREHLPDRIRAGGYTRARRYVAIDAAPRYLTAFEADSPEALASGGYLKLVATLSDQSKRIRAGFSRVVRNTFRVRADARTANGGVVAVWRLRGRSSASPTSIDALVPTLIGERVVAAQWLAPRSDIRAQMDSHRVTGLDDAAVDHVLMLELADADDIAPLRAAALSDRAWSDAGFEVEAFGSYRLMVDFAAADR